MVQVAESARQFADNFANVTPTPFLDDMSTKNVLVDSGERAGIIDVDWICYGDLPFTIALTRASILNMRTVSDYTDHWWRLLDVTTVRCRTINLYTVPFCIDFLGELGTSFTETMQYAEPEESRNLEHMVTQHLRQT